MSKINFTEYLPYISIIIGLISVVFAVGYNSKKGKLKETGILAEGIIFNQGSGGNYNNSFDNSFAPVNDNITVRFVTQKQEWITGKI